MNRNMCLNTTVDENCLEKEITKSVIYGNKDHLNDDIPSRYDSVPDL